MKKQVLNKQHKHRTIKFFKMISRITLLFLILLVEFSAFGQKRKLVEIEALVEKWAEANTAHNIESLKTLYSESIAFYGKTKSVDRCLEEKDIFFKKNPDYWITISDFDTDIYKSGIIKCNFTKNEFWGGEEKKPQLAYLLFEKKEGKYVVIGESDQRMDSQRGYSAPLGDKKAANNGLFLIIGIAGGIFVAGLLFFFLIRKKNKQVPIPVSLAKNEDAVSIDKPVNTNNQKPVVEIVSSAIPQTSTEKGYEFEKWVVAKFPKTYYEIKEWRSDKYHEGRFASSNMLPDLEIAYRHKNRYAVFAVECKWRSDFQNGKIEWASADQLARYKDFERSSSKPVFIVIGIGGSPDAPQNLYSIPIRVINSTVLTQYQLKNYNKYKSADFFFDSYNNILS